MAKISAGLLLYRVREGALQVLLAHPGGPLWRKKDLGAWSIPKGEVGAGEDFLVAARREFLEELGVEAAGEFRALSPVKQKGGKVVHAWAFEGDLDVGALKSNTFEMEWPPRSGKRATFPEVDRVEFFALATARAKINPGQVKLLDEVESLLRGR